MNISRRRILQTAAPMMIPRVALAAVQDALRSLPGAADRGPRFFVMGAAAQAGPTFAAWKARGINTVINATDDFAGGDGPGWRAAAHANNLHMIVGGRHMFDGGYPPSGGLGGTWPSGKSDSYALNQSDPLVIAALLYDEPDLTGPPLAAHDAEVAFARSQGFTKPIHVNFSNNPIGIAYTSLNPMQFINWATDQWPSSDNYPYQGGWPYIFGDFYAANGFTGPFTTMSGHAAYNLNTGPVNGVALTHPGQPTFQYISTGRLYNGAPGGLPWPRLTPLQYGLQAWSCIINGVSGLLHFATYNAGLPGFIADDTDRVLEGAIADLVAKVAILEGQVGGNVLMDTLNGGRRSYTLRQGAWSLGGTAGNPTWPDKQPTFADPVGNQMQAWFEGAEIAVGSETYRLVLNLHDSVSKTLNDRHWGMANVSFAAGQVKCFKASAPTVDIFGL
jgi:hypothetical protein